MNGIDVINWCGAKKNLKVQADEWLNKHYTEKFSLDAISGDLAVHPNYLARVYKEISGETLLNRHNRIRCEKACELLKETDSSISYIANLVGYQTSSHFTVVFKRFMGCTPKDYRAQYIFSNSFLPVSV